MTPSDRSDSEKLDEVLDRLARIESRCKPCTEEVRRHRMTLNGDGQTPGLIGRSYIHSKQIKSIDRLRWWLLGYCGVLTSGVLLLIVERFLGE